MIRRKPDIIVDVIDTSNVERNLYLAVQLMEMDVPIVLAFNMSDLARQRGLVFDMPQLAQLLGAPIVETVAHKDVGIEGLLHAIADYTRPHDGPIPRCRYGAELEQQIEDLAAVIRAQPDAPADAPLRWYAIKLIENDDEILDRLTAEAVRQAARNARRRIETVFGDDPAIVLADHRYGFISGACTETVRTTVQMRHDRSDRIDAIITHPLLGLVIFIGLMYLVFQLTFDLGHYPMQALEWLFARSAVLLADLWPDGRAQFLKSLLIDGIIGGVGGVIVFVPNIMLLFAAIAILEDSGYMARAAFLMDRVMHKIGLHGKSFIPMLIGFGCSVPAIMATRILENRRNRLATMLVIPLMSCGARFPIYALIIPAFFPEHLRGLILWIVYLVGILLAVLCVRLLRATLLRGETIPFVMELPPYRMPTLRGLAIHTWTRSRLYLQKAATMILAISIVLWAMTSYPKPPAEDLAGLTAAEAHSAELQYSIAGRIGRAIEPAVSPIGFDWKIATALIGATAAKEVFVAQLGILYSVQDAEEGGATTLRQRLRNDYSPLQALCIMLFCLISAPCVATVVVTRRESGAWRWALLQWAGLTAIAYAVTLVVFQVGRLFGG